MITNFITGITYILGLIVILIYILLSGTCGYQMLYQNKEGNEVTFKKFLFGFFAFHFVTALVVWLISGIGWLINLFI